MDDDDNKNLARFDQAMAMLADNLPPLWRRMYERMLEVGFAEDQAMSLLRAYVFAAAGGRLEK